MYLHVFKLWQIKPVVGNPVNFIFSQNTADKNKLNQPQLVHGQIVSQLLITMWDGATVATKCSLFLDETGLFGHLIKRIIKL